MSDKRLMSIKFKGIDQTYVIPTVIADDANNDGNVVVKNYPSEAYAQHSVDKANPHSVTAEQVGAAPAGYGVGSEVKSLSSTDDLHALKVGGRYGWASDAPQNAPAKYLVMDLMFRDKSGTYGVANFYTTSPFAIYQSFGRIVISDGEWGEFEWENPPLHTNKEYRTTERFDDKVIFKKKDSNGKLWYRLDGSDTQIEGLPGAAPSGYGLGEYCKSISMDALDSTTINGWYQTSGSITIDNTIMWHPRMFVIAGDAVNLAQELYPISVNEKISNTKLRRRCHDGVWQPWEWENPPMAVDVEYRTTERIDGKAVYKKRDSNDVIMYRLDGDSTWTRGLPGAAPAYPRLSQVISTAGWYKVGTLKPEGGDFTTAGRITIGGNYSYVNHAATIIDVATDYDTMNAVVTVHATKNAGVSKVGFIRSEMKIYDVYVYYNHNSPNTVYVTADMVGGTFVEGTFEAAQVSESDMIKVVNVSRILTTADNLNDIRTSGEYAWTGSSPTNAPQWPTPTNGYATYSYVQVIPSATDGGCTQIAYTSLGSARGVRQERYCVDGTWGEWEWVNPPMSLGVEYRTTERWNGMPVYTKLVDCGAMPNNSTKEVTVFTGSECKILRVSGYTGYTNNTTSFEKFTLPYKVSSSYEMDCHAKSNGTNANIVLYSSYDTSGFGQTYVTVWYVKT